MSIVVTAPVLDRSGGVAAYYATLREHLQTQVRFCSTGSRADHESFLVRSARLLGDYGRFCRMVGARRCALVHLNPSLGPKALLRDGLSLLIAKALGKKVLVFLRGWNCACESSIRHRYLSLFRRVYFQADAFIVLASQFQSVLRELGYDKPIYVETTVVPDEVFARARIKLARPQLHDTGANILFLSRIEEGKGIYEALNAFRLLREKRPSATLTVAGDGAELENARKYVRTEALDGVRFLGWITGEQKHQAYSDADVYLFPTRWGEGMPQSVLEAMAYGLPVITRPVGGLVDFFEPGRMGYLTDSSDPQVLASFLERLMRDHNLRREIAQYNHAFAGRHFAASVVARRLAEIYQGTIHGKRDMVPSTPAENAAGGGSLSMPADSEEDLR
jgi:glycosyltransferase involved in cell wall biosynthesis